MDKADPFAFFDEVPPRTASIVRDLDYEWGDQQWMQIRHTRNSLQAPMSVYEVHIGSWMRVPEEGNRSLSYRELAPKLADYVKRAGFTHVEFMPVMEHPFHGSWGYQITGFFAPTSRYGTPQDFMFLVDYLHQNGIGVILDWVPSHFPSDEHGLAYFDGTHLYEHADMRMGFHPDWKSYIFNYGRNEVRSFLLSSAIFWLDRYHADGLRVDAVASMLYLDYSRKEGEWIPNRYGGRENLDAITFLQRMNHDVYQSFPVGADHRGGIHGVADGLQADLSRRARLRAQVGHGLDARHAGLHEQGPGASPLSSPRCSPSAGCTPSPRISCCRSRMTRWCTARGRCWARCRATCGRSTPTCGCCSATCGRSRARSCCSWAASSASGRSGTTTPAWNGTCSSIADHAGVLKWVEDLNRVMREEPALHALDIDPRGFEWIDANDGDNSVLTFLRKTEDPNDTIVVALNFTPVPRKSYRVGVPQCGYWRELLNSDGEMYGGSGMGNAGGRQSDPVPLA